MSADALDSTVADVCLVVEGTYPYVLGGVSSWIHGLITALPELTFRVWYIGADAGGRARELHYALPSNVLGLHIAALRGQPVERRASRADRARWQARFEGLFAAVLHGPPSSSAQETERAAHLREFTAACIEGRDYGLAPLEVQTLMNEPWLWSALRARYEQEASRESFAGFYWTWKGALQPLLPLCTTPVPAARCFHAVSTGYAGWLAARGSLESGVPLLVTEHGIYTKERRIELGRTKWIVDRSDSRDCPDAEPPFFRAWWTRYFTGMSWLTYAAAARVLTIHRGNTALQLRDGAEARKLQVIPNGVDIARISAAVVEARRELERVEHAPGTAAAVTVASTVGFTVGFIGRVTPIKDVMMLIDATALASRSIEGLRVRIMGPRDEDEDYCARCVEEVRRHGLEHIVSFDGPVDVARELARIDVVVLTSISEAQPLVIIEAFAASLPVVATSVGAVPELLMGAPGEDAELGPAGIVTPIGAPGAAAAAWETLARSPELRARMGRAGSERARRFYGRDLMVDAYRRVYTEHLAQPIQGAL